MVAGHRALLLLLAAALLAAVVSVASAEEAKPTPQVGSVEGDMPGADDAMKDDDAAPVGAPIGTTVTDPEPEATTTPGAVGEATPAASAASSLAVVARIGAAATVVVAGAFAF